MRRALVAVAAAGALMGVGCGDEGGSANGSDAGTDLVFGCPTHPNPLAQPGDDIGGDDYATYARPFFDTYCVRCHSSTLTTPRDRNFAPLGLNWDVEESVRANLPLIREAVGIINFMPPSDPTPSCDERERLVRWIDANAP